MGQVQDDRRGWGLAARLVVAGVWALLLCGVGLASMLYVGMMSEPGQRGHPGVD